MSGATGVPGAVGSCCGAGLLCGARPLCVPVGGGPPTRSPHASCARSGRSRGPPWPCRHPPALRQMPPAPSTPVGPGVLTCGLVRWVEAWTGPDTARGHCSRSLRRPPHLWGRVTVRQLYASSRSPARPRSRYARCGQALRSLRRIPAPPIDRCWAGNRPKRRPLR